MKSKHEVLAQKLLDYLKLKSIRLGETIYTAFKSDLKTNKESEFIKDFREKENLNENEIFHILLFLADDGLLLKRESSAMRYSFSPTPESTYVFETSVKTYSKPLKQSKIFVIREFENKLTKSIYEKAVKPAIISSHLEPQMLEDKELVKLGNLNSYIKNAIKNCFAVICDITPKFDAEDCNHMHWNANVFFEAGIADGLDKKIIYIANERIKDKNNISKLPFDISSHNIIFYDENNFIELKKVIFEHLKSIMSTNE